MRFPDGFLEDIKARVPISGLLGRKLSWDSSKSSPRKGLFWACCPFHGEKTPSFRADDERGRYYCFGCKAKGDHFGWLTDRDGMTFPEAVAAVAEMAGMALPKMSPEEEKRETLRASIFEINRAAAEWYHAQLLAEGGHKGQAMLRARGVPKSQWVDLQLGFAPNARSDLFKHLSKLKFGEDDIIAAGLAKDPVGSNLPADMFFNRLMIPIRDRSGRHVGFGARALDPDQQPKFLNTKDSPAFSKGRLLYNLDRAAEAARTAADLILVEGYFDVAAMERAGVAHAVAPLGTAITPEQLELAWRHADEPALCLDGDKAGQAAALKAAHAALPLLKAGRSLAFITLDGGLDPDETERKFGADALSQGLKARRSLIDVIWADLVSRADWATPERRVKLEADVIAIAAAISDDAVRKAYEGELQQRLKAFWKDKGVAAGKLKFGKGSKPVKPGGGDATGIASGGGYDDAMRERMNRDYAVLVLGQKTIILRDGRHDAEGHREGFSLLSVDAFGVWMKNRKCWHMGKMRNLAEVWLEDPERRQYRGCYFMPGAPGETVDRAGYYNLWRGYPVTPKENAALAKPFFDHVENVLASGDETLFKWCINFFAAKIQQPRRRFGVSLIIRGAEGTGKTITGKIFGELMPANYYLVDDARYLTGQFNSHLASCSFLQVDEGFWAGDKGAEGRLKGLITSGFQMVEFKGVDPVRMDNFCTVMMTSNEDWVVPVAPKGRRYAVIDIDPSRARDSKYFGALSAHFEQPDAKAALLHALAAWPLDEDGLRRVPGTDALLAQKVRSFDPLQSFLFEMLQRGAVGDGTAWPGWIKCSDLHAHYLKRCERYNARHMLGPESFGRQLFAFLPGVMRKRRRENGGQPFPVYVLGDLDQLRQGFAQEIGHAIDWGDGLEEMGVEVDPDAF